MLIVVWAPDYGIQMLKCFLLSSTKYLTVIVYFSHVLDLHYDGLDEPVILLGALLLVSFLLYFASVSFSSVWKKDISFQGKQSPGVQKNTSLTIKYIKI